MRSLYIFPSAGTPHDCTTSAGVGVGVPVAPRTVGSGIGVPSGAGSTEVRAGTTSALGIPASLAAADSINRLPSGVSSRSFTALGEVAACAVCIPPAVAAPVIAPFIASSSTPSSSGLSVA